MSQELTSAPVRSFSDRALGRPLIFAGQERIAAMIALAGVFGVAALSYWWTHAPLYNPAGTLDPWLYTALFVNFDRMNEHFGDTYYASRLPWIVPGRIAYAAFRLDIAYWVLHGLAFCGGVAALFVLVRRYVGVAAAVVGAGTLALTPLYWNAQYWDYIDGVTLTYLLAGMCFGLPVTCGPRRAALLVAAGVFFAAAVTTNVFVAVVALIYPIAYVFVQPTTGVRQRCVLALKDAVALFAGASALVIALGLHARANGGQFLFFQPQIDVVRAGTGAPKAPYDEWLREEPRLLVPIFLLAVAAPLIALGRGLPPFRFAVGSTSGLAFLTVFIYGWEFLAGGNILELPYYFSYYTISIALTMASVAALAVSLAGARRAANVGVALASTVGAVVALGLIFREDRQDWTGWTGMKISVAVMAVAALLVLCVALGRHTSVGTAAAVSAVGAIALASHFAINSSWGPFVSSFTAPDNRGLYHAAFDHVGFVERSIARDDPLPAFWWPAKKRPDLSSIQSMYYAGHTAIDHELPHINTQMRERLELWRPKAIVMLCRTRDCGGGVTALRRAGHPYAESAAEHISHGRISFWAVLVRRGSRE